ncbi:Na+/H+ antiporter NhaC [Acidaminobacter hydrogenoformans]|uniref:Sodium/proton antiporter, NhaC family (TC 2.A.35.1.1) n=1 Tax=Acidaminobacter hydrogenoformans DSM 2784 TaxID=1120920 RepID=A0A1G5RW42_9FIRM|nr:Na+/H+ antiporter NhaC [Acidaminobacter hydrogenoformans]SCZ78332.1 sodium/proton antiporter, NhaC family (TC 2.A.35.1.1) [Acidaminobacter hydrogenoformans DSM 2784]
METKMKKKATLGHALIPMVFIIVALIVTMQFWGGDPHLPILFSAVVAAIVAIFGLGYTWKELEDGIVDTIKMSMQAILILMIIGMIIGTWILGGIVPTMIYYGLKILSPGIFLVATCILCSIVSLATGSSWTTAGTVGIALIGVGIGLGMNPGIVAGAIISGAYFGDKMSPLSDTTNLAPAMAGSTLFDHIRHMIYTTGPSLIIALILYGIIGMRYAGNELDTGAINEILMGIEANFNISLILLLAPVLVIVMVIFKVPAMPGLIGGTVLGALFAFLFQGAGMSAIVEAAHYGYYSETGVTVIDDLLSRGGLDSMMWTVSLILCAMSFGGVMEKSGMLEAIASSILKLAHGTGSLVLATIITIIAMNMMAGDQYLAIVIPGRMYRQVYADRGLHPKNLSRVLEDAGTLTSPLVPWNSCGLFMSGTLGVATLVYLPYCFLNLINPLISIFYGFTGITMEKLPPEETVA